MNPLLLMATSEEAFLVESILGVISKLGFYAVLLFGSLIIPIIAYWKLFKKAGIPGWYSIVPLVNAYQICKMALGNGWLFLLTCVPLVGSLFNYYIYYRLGRSIYGR